MRHIKADELHILKTCFALSKQARHRRARQLRNDNPQSFFTASAALSMDEAYLDLTDILQGIPLAGEMR